MQKIAYTDKLEQNIKRYIDYKTNLILNTFFDIRDAKIATGDLRKIQLTTAILLGELDKICRENGIEYWLDYGTLLGAYRTGGFIPWDDDIDVGMMRKDFEKLQQIIVNYKNFKLTEWLHLKNGFDIHCRVAKFCFNRNDLHLFVDIFPYDYCNCDNMQKYYDKYSTDKDLLRKDLEALNMPQYSFCACDNENDLKIINGVFEKYTKKYYSLDDGNTILYGMENPYNPARRIFSKETIFPLKEIYFENHKYFIPNNTDKYLTVNFGDYLKIPNNVGVVRHPKYTNEEMDKISEILSINKVRVE